jgi:hypothetical protein
MVDTVNRAEHLEKELTIAREQIIEMQHRERGVADQVSRAVAVALREQREKDALQRDEQISRLEGECQRLRLEAADRLDSANEQHRVR